MNADFQIVCQTCTAINRVPKKRLKDAPKCGRCHKSLLTGECLELNDGNFQRVLSGGSQPLLIMFWAPWCGYCQKALPDYKQALAALEPEIRLATLNTEANRISAGRYAVNSLPTLILFKQGKEIARQPGAMTTAQIVGWAHSKIT